MECTYPLTGIRCISRVYTDHAIFAIDSADEGGLRVLETFGLSVRALGERMSVPLH